MPADEPARSQRKGEARRQQRRSDHQVRGRRQHGAAAPNGDAAERDLQNEQGEGQEGGPLEAAVAPVGAARDRRHRHHREHHHHEQHAADHGREEPTERQRPVRHGEPRSRAGDEASHEKEKESCRGSQHGQGVNAAHRVHGPSSIAVCRHDTEILLCPRRVQYRNGRALSAFSDPSGPFPHPRLWSYRSVPHPMPARTKTYGTATTSPSTTGHARPHYPLTDVRARANVAALCGLISSRTTSGWTFLTRSSIAATIASTSAAESVSTKSTLIAATICWGPRCTMNRPYDRSAPGWARAIAQIDETTSSAAGSPMRSPLASRARNIATTPSRTPMPMEAAPSSTGRSNVSLAAIPPRAIIKPISAAVSSKSTMNMVGSLL